MGKRRVLGHFEFAVLSIVRDRRGEAYGVNIYEDLETKEHEPSLAAIYVTLRRLEEKGMVTSSETEPTEARGGRRKRVYEITGLGERALSETLAIFTQAQQALAWGNGR